MTVKIQAAKVPVRSQSMSLEAGNSSQPADPAKESISGSLPKIVKFEQLARCGEEIWIENDGQIYRLRKTKHGKLILTK